MFSIISPRIMSQLLLEKNQLSMRKCCQRKNSMHRFCSPQHAESKHCHFFLWYLGVFCKITSGQKDWELFFCTDFLYHKQKHKTQSEQGLRGKTERKTNFQQVWCCLMRISTQTLCPSIHMCKPLKQSSIWQQRLKTKLNIWAALHPQCQWHSSSLHTQLNSLEVKI